MHAARPPVSEIEAACEGEGAASPHRNSGEAAHPRRGTTRDRQPGNVLLSSICPMQRGSHSSGRLYSSPSWPSSPQTAGIIPLDRSTLGDGGVVHQQNSPSRVQGSLSLSVHVEEALCRRQGPLTELPLHWRDLAFHLHFRRQRTRHTTPVIPSIQPSIPPALARQPSRSPFLPLLLTSPTLFFCVSSSFSPAAAHLSSAALRLQVPLLSPSDKPLAGSPSSRP